MIDRWVDEKIRCPPSLAALNRRATSADRFSESPNCMAGGVGLELEEEATEVEVGMRGAAITKAVMDGTMRSGAKSIRLLESYN